MADAGQVTVDDEVAPASIVAPALRSTTSGLLVLITMIAFEAMAVSAALPTAARELHGLRDYGWAFTGFLVATVVAMVIAGMLADSSGPRLPLVAGLVCFGAGLVLAGSASGMPQFIAGRVVQGFGGGLLITAVYVVIGAAYPDRLHPKVFAAVSTAWVLPSLVGPVVSGALAQHASWRWVFLGLAPFVAVAAVLLLPVLRTLPDRRGPLPPGAGMRLTRALAVAAGVAALENAGQHPSPGPLVLGVGGLVALGWGLVGLLPAGTFRVRPGVSAPVALRALMAAAFFGVEATVPLSLSVQHGFGATAAGLPLAASGFSWAAGSWIQGRQRSPALRAGIRRRLIRSGFGCVALAAAGMGAVSQTGVPGWFAYPAWALAGLGAGMAMSSVSVLLLDATTEADRGRDSAALQLADSTGNALTTGLAGVLVAAAARGDMTFGAAFGTLDAILCAVALAGALAAGRVDTG